MAPINFLGCICTEDDSFHGECTRSSNLSAAFSNRVFAYKSESAGMRKGVKNTKLKINYNSGEFLSENEVDLKIPKYAKVSNIEGRLFTILGKHIIFSVVHPKGGFKDKDPYSVFNKGIRSAGTMRDAWIDYTGRPKLKAKINITDTEVESLIKQGKVFISYAHWRDESSPTISPFDFDHLLIFPRKVVSE